MENEIRHASDIPATGSPVRTVCNDTYTADAYLEPVSSRKLDADDNIEKCNHMTPLLDINVQRRESGKKKFENHNHGVTVEAAEPIFKRKAEHSLSQSKLIKNKQTIYPCEQVTLLSDAGSSSRCFETADITLHQETTQC